MTREEVYDKINQERNFQDSFIKEKFNNLNYPNNIPTEILMMESYIRKAIDAWTSNKIDQAVLNEVIKILAIGVRCMENHGKSETNIFINLDKESNIIKEIKKTFLKDNSKDRNIKEDLEFAKKHTE